MTSVCSPWLDGGQYPSDTRRMVKPFRDIPMLTPGYPFGRTPLR